MLTLAAHVADQLHVHGLDRRAGDVGIGRDEVDVQLEGVGARLLDLARVLDPAARGDAVQAADHGDVDGGLGLPHVLEIAVGPES